ncbi:MAG TPA: molecular chaperone DnaJ [Chloroflexota bacterium]|nr:molecular chaperone DnaJ [Chloroflexota bacterium]
MATKRDYYDILGISRGASDVEIKQAFRTQARKYHPDVNKSDDAHARFKEINEAYEVLSDPRKRSAYDRYGQVGQGAGFEGFSDLGGFADIFETFFGAGARRGGQRGPQRGTDLRYDMSISFQDAVFGTEKEIEVPVLQICTKCDGSGAEPGSGSTTCPRCHGSGEMRRVQQSVFGQFVNVVACDRCQGEGQIVSEPCGRCHGQGRERRTKKLTIKIPAGVDRGQQIRLAGEGEIGPKGGPPGDLYVVLDVEEHETFKRDGYDIYYELPLTVAQAALGDDVAIPTLDGEKELHVPAGTQSGRTFRLRGQGVPHLRSPERGSMFVVARVAIPTKLTARQRELFEELAKELGDAPHDKGFFDKVKEAFGG